MSAAAAAPAAGAGLGARAKGAGQSLDAASLPLSGSTQRGAKRAKAGTTAKVARRIARVPAVHSGLGTLRGFAAGSLALIALEVLSRRADQFGGFLAFTATLARHAISPDVPAIPWLSKTPPGGPSPASAASASPAAAQTQAVVTPVLGLNPNFAYAYSAPLLTEQRPPSTT